MNSLVCFCNGITENEILTALKKGAQSTSDIQRMTRAGTSCGKCLAVIDSLVEEYLAKIPVDPQQKIKFDL
ncbi:MAG: (2Fe-2S)-binding protein [Bacteroidota bacterium]|nr:(2Fe-2S)-binding protein [Bacteroidota bacterium]